MSKAEVLKTVRLSESSCLKPLCESSNNGAFRRASLHYINKKVSKIEIVHSVQILQSAVKI